MKLAARFFALRAPLLRLLTFLRVVDAHDGLVSLVNLALLVAVAKLALVRGAGIPDISALMLTLLAYAHKKHVNAKAQATEDETSKAATEVAQAAHDKVTALQGTVEALVGTYKLGGGSRR